VVGKLKTDFLGIARAKRKAIAESATAFLVAGTGLQPILSAYY
jgi:hypothetical protein